MRQTLRSLDKTIAGPVLAWLKRPLVDASPWRRRLRPYSYFLLMIVLSSPFVHAYLDIALSPREMLIHTGLVVAAVALTMLTVEAGIAMLLCAVHRQNRISAGGFLLRATIAYLLSGPAVGLVHHASPFASMIVEKHARAGQSNIGWHLPLALLIVYITYQLTRKEYLARQVTELQRINHALELARCEPSGPQYRRMQRSTSAAFSVRSNGVETPLAVESILRIQADENYCHVVADASPDEPSKRHLVRMTLNEAIGKLPDDLFLQTHRSHVVNLRYVAELIRDGRQRELRLTTGDRVPISRARNQSVQSRIAAFLAAGEATPVGESVQSRSATSGQPLPSRH